jgi:prefoldin subunit 5
MYFLFICLIINNICFSQDTTLQKLVAKGKADTYINTINKKANALTKSIENTTTKTLQQLHKAENKLQQKLARKNPPAAQRLFDSATPYYQRQLNQIKDTTVVAGALKEYIPALDSLHTALGWITGGIYYVGELTIPGGWPAAMEAGSRNTQNNREILGASWNPRPGGGLGN